MYYQYYKTSYFEMLWKNFTYIGLKFVKHIPPKIKKNNIFKEFQKELKTFLIKSSVFTSWIFVHLLDNRGKKTTKEKTIVFNSGNWRNIVIKIWILKYCCIVEFHRLKVVGLNLK